MKNKGYGKFGGGGGGGKQGVLLEICKWRISSIIAMSASTLSHQALARAGRPKIIFDEV